MPMIAALADPDSIHTYLTAVVAAATRVQGASSRLWIVWALAAQGSSARPVSVNPQSACPGSMMWPM